MRYQSIFRPGLFEGQTIVITGGGSGIGRAAAHELAALGAHVALAARKIERLTHVRDEIVAAGGSASAHVCNIRDEAQVAALFDAVLAERGAVHGLFNNGGGQFLSPAGQIALKGWNAVVETNLTGTFLMCREAFNRCMSQHGGAVVNMLMENWRGFPGMAHSAAARAGVENLTRTLAVEWAASGVRINAVAPGLIQSSGLATYGEAIRPFLEQYRRDIPAKRLGTEAEVAAAVTFLLSPAAAYISGATLKIDGASSLWRKTWEIAEHDRAAPPFFGFDEPEREDSSF
jgi:citronellol/citronellal dehydrogenase